MGRKTGGGTRWWSEVWGHQGGGQSYRGGEGDEEGGVTAASRFTLAAESHRRGGKREVTILDLVLLPFPCCLRCTCYLEHMLGLCTANNPCKPGPPCCLRRTTWACPQPTAPAVPAAPSACSVTWSCPSLKPPAAPASSKTTCLHPLLPLPPPRRLAYTLCCPCLLQDDLLTPSAAPAAPAAPAAFTERSGPVPC